MKFKTKKFYPYKFIKPRKNQCFRIFILQMMLFLNYKKNNFNININKEISKSVAFGK